MTKTFLIVGTLRNCADVFRTEMDRIERALSPLGSVYWFVVESDSQDDTLACIEQIKRERPQFDYASLGHLEGQTSLRTDRIAQCRNRYLDELPRIRARASITHVVVADLDGVNAQLTQAAVQSCWRRQDWDVVTANQAGPYYDIWALRHPLWCPNDYLERGRFFIDHGLSPTFAGSIASRGINLKIPPDQDWIEVTSAFGGFAIYRADVLTDVHYEGVGPQGHQVCEHVSLNTTLSERGHRLFINPALINAHITEHTHNLRKLDKLWSNVRMLFVEPDLINTGERRRPWVQRLMRRMNRA